MDTSIIVALISAAGSIIAALIAARGQGGGGSRREPGEEVSVPRRRSERRGLGSVGRVVLWIVAGLFALAFLASLVEEFTPTPAAAFCCDLAGMRRCPLSTPLPAGATCFCPAQGTGFACP
jgi:hypothetical protein